MTCEYLDCTNAARYVDQDGRSCCATCPIKASKDSIRVADVSTLLGRVRELVDHASSMQFEAPSFALFHILLAEISDLRQIIGRAP